MNAFDRMKQLLDLFRPPAPAACRGEDDRRVQVAAAAFRGTGDGTEILLITSRDTGRWIVPKGWIEPGEDGATAAIREAWEEAGVIAELAADAPVSRYRYVKQGGRRGDAVCDVEVYLIRALSEQDRWPEKAMRTRQWFPLAAAIDLINEAGLKAVIRDAAQLRPAA